MILSNHFTLEEFVISQEAARRGLDNTPNAFQIANMIRLCQTVLEPIREKVGPILISSGFRSVAVNRFVGGVENSQHTKGCAADIHVPGMRVVDLFEGVRKMGLQYDQMINEFGVWLHISVPDKAGMKPRNEALIYTRGAGGITHKERV